ncbi:MAG: hypothetical protein H0Z34_01020 [Brevibacillus sp.]|nr:hypothetical protein [Brevibacillus sp.]
MSLFDHFRKEEHPFAERALEMLLLAEQRQTMRLTDFLDPRQLFILQSLTSQVSDVRVEGYGGYEGAERVRALIHPGYIVPEPDDFKLTLAEIKGDQRFVKLSHRDVLGALLHIGLKREKFGDILMDDEGCQIIVASEVFPYVRMQVTQIHRIPVELVSVEWERLRLPVQKRREKSFTVASPRLDAVIGEVFRLSRSKALIPVRAGRAKVNWKVVDDPAHLLQPGDVVSLSGFGRFEVYELTAARSGRIRMTVGEYA